MSLPQKYAKKKGHFHPPLWVRSWKMLVWGDTWNCACPVWGSPLVVNPWIHFPLSFLINQRIQLQIQCSLWPHVTKYCTSGLHYRAINYFTSLHTTTWSLDESIGKSTQRPWESVSQTSKVFRPTDVIGLWQDVLLHDSTLWRRSSSCFSVIFIVIVLIIVLICHTLLGIWL